MVRLSNAEIGFHLKEARRHSCTLNKNALKNTDQNTNSIMHTPSRITIAHGDGIGPEIMDAVLYILDKAGANL
jgi:endonuclease III-like uncharacterized protein